VSHSFCSECNRIRLTSDGKIKPCLHSDEEIDLKDSLRSGRNDEEIMADIKKALLDTVFQKPKDHQFNKDGSGDIKREMYKIGG